MSGERLQVEVLGDLRVCDADGRDVTPDGALQRRLLSLLLLRRGRIVPADTAIEALWGDRPPRDPSAALHNHLFRLRRGLPGDLIESVGDGYRIAADAVDLDVDRLRLALAAEPGDERAGATVDAILARWTGPAFTDLEELDEARAESARLAELRVHALEARAERRLATSDTHGLVAELTALCDEQPLRERPRALLMAALAATGRPVEALRVFDDFRRSLGDELGIEPSPVLAAQHAALLAGTAGSAAGAAAAAWTPATRLPIALTSIVGRDELIGELQSTLGSHRLVTLTGPGGVGKTRLLLEVGGRLRSARPEQAVAMCELAPVDPESAVEAIATALGIDARPGVAPTDRITALLADAAIVLLLDNCEHVVEVVAGFVERLLSTCPNVTVLATSRERLRVPGERVQPIPTLTSGAGADGAASLLFVERARAVNPDFEPSSAQRDVIAEIVERLDGLPLAIEIAAARAHTLDVTELAAGLDRSLLVSGGHRTTARHSSLRASVAWSFDLLEPRLQQMFGDLSLFSGPFDRAAAKAVAGIDQHTTELALDQLVERSLLMRAPGQRYRMLETLRAFGREQLEAGNRLGAASARHAAHFVSWAKEADMQMVGPDGASVIAAIDANLSDLRIALDWLLEHGDLDRAGRLIAALIDYAFLRLRPDVLAWAYRVIAADPDGYSPHAPVVWAASSYAAWMVGDLGDAGARAFRALRLNEQLGGPISSEACRACASYELFQGNLDVAANWYRRARNAAVDDPSQRILAGCSEVLARAYGGDSGADGLASEMLAETGGLTTPQAAYAWYCAGEADLSNDVDRARRRLTRALELAEATDASFVTGVAGASRASIEARCGDPLQAAEEYRSLIHHWRRAGMWSTQWTMLRAIAGLLARLDRPREAAALTGAVRATDSGHRIFGDDAVALAELESNLRSTLGDAEFARAAGEGTELDGDAAVELALRSL